MVTGMPHLIPLLLAWLEAARGWGQMLKRQEMKSLLGREKKSLLGREKSRLLGRELATVVEAEQPQQVFFRKKPHLILLSRKNSTQQITWANEVEILRQCSYILGGKKKKGIWGRCGLKYPFLQEALVFHLDEKKKKDETDQFSPKNLANSVWLTQFRFTCITRLQSLDLF